MEKEVNWSLIRYHSEIRLTVRHMILFQSTIKFEKFEANILTKGNNLKTASIELGIDPASLTSFNSTKSDLFNLEQIENNYNLSQIRFVSGMIEKSDKNGNHILPGRLTINGINNFVKLKIRFTKISHDPWGDATAGFMISGKLKRKDWKLGPKIFAGKGISFLSNHIHVSCKIHMSKINQEMLINNQKEGLRNGKVVYSRKFNVNPSATANNDS